MVHEYPHMTLPCPSGANCQHLVRQVAAAPVVDFLMGWRSPFGNPTTWTSCSRREEDFSSRSLYYPNENITYILIDFYFISNGPIIIGG